jgi:hypothetical protein
MVSFIVYREESDGEYEKDSSDDKSDDDSIVENDFSSDDELFNTNPSKSNSF